jgi:crotonobetainyl-CoA:carnitine CoA-transferase CaiB-like acyl-CoA transferase
MSSGLPLDDIRVIDLTVARAGPACVRQLADGGADVIRVEPPADLNRDAKTRHGSDFQNLHRTKRSLAVNLKAPGAVEVVMRLVDTADVLIENMRPPVKPPVKERLGFGWDAVRERNPRLIYGSISGFDQDGPYAGRGSVDQIAQGMGGLMSVTGLPGMPPTRVGVPVIGLPDLPDDPRLRTAASRLANRPQLSELIGERPATRPTAARVQELNAAGVPCGPVYTMDEVFADPQVEHLAGLGYAGTEIDQLTSRGVIEAPGDPRGPA